MGTANQVEQELMNYISDHKIINTHSHHLPEQMMTDFSLDNSKNPLYFALKYSGFSLFYDLKASSNHFLLHLFNYHCTLR